MPQCSFGLPSRRSAAASRNLKVSWASPCSPVTGAGVTLTEAGQTLYERAQLLLRDLRKAREDVVTTSQVPRGHLRLAVPPAAGQVLCPPVIKRYSELYPHVSLHIHEGFSGYMYEWLLTGRVDIAVMHNPTPQAQPRHRVSADRADVRHRPRQEVRRATRTGRRQSPTASRTSPSFPSFFRAGRTACAC